MAAAANRAQDALTTLILHIKQSLDNDVALENQIITSNKSVEHKLEVIAKHLNIDPKELELDDSEKES